MLDYDQIRNLYITADNIKSSHKVIAEWNMNKYIEIKKYGLYKGSGESITVYNENDNNILTGENYLIYDDGQKEVDPSQKVFSNLSSIFRPNRPDPGIVLLQYFPNMTFAPDNSNVKVSKMTTSSARYYPFSESREYDYFNSAKLLDFISGTQQNSYFGISNPSTGMIESSNPFVIYNTASGFLCNKITIKLQNHLCVPEEFSIDILPPESNIWKRIYSSNTSTDFLKGVLNIYFSNDTWSKTVARVTDLDELVSASPTQSVKIQGLRFNVKKLTNVKFKNSPDVLSAASLELIEFSPRLEVDLSEYVESFSISTSMGDSNVTGIPVGAVVSGTGQINLSNEENQFLISSTLSSLKMLNQDVKFSFYQNVEVPSASQTYVIPLKVLYSNEWNVGQDYSVSTSLEDGLKYLREAQAPDLLFSSNAALSSIILILLDNVGITGLEFKKSSNYLQHNKEDTAIRNFFCKKEQTVAEVLEQLAIATQCSIFYDAYGKLNVLTKERVSENASASASTGTLSIEPKTDFWFIGDENFTASFTEYDYIKNYKANISSLQEEKINPLTDGEIVYHSYGPKKSAFANSIESDRSKILDQLNLDQIPLAALAFSNYGYSTTILWNADTRDSSAVLGAANVYKNIPETRIKTQLQNVLIDAIDEDDLIRKIYSNILTTVDDKQKLIIYIDSNEGISISPYEGTILVDSEYIKYRGKLFNILRNLSDGVTQSGYYIVFTEEEYYQIVSRLQKGDSMLFMGLVVDVKTKIKSKNINGTYTYEIIDDGRGALSSKVDSHPAFAEDSNGIDNSKKFKLQLGSTKSESDANLLNNLTTTTKFNFLDKIRYKSGKNKLGNLPSEYLQSYLGFLHVSGPNSPQSETDILLSILDKNKSPDIISKLQAMNKQVDDKVPGNFDDFVYMQGERNIYGQKIILPFTPNVISTRMRLYSARRKINNNQEIMSTNSSIAGIGFGLNNNNEGYYLEIESAGSGKDFVGEKNAVYRNLRFYKVTLESSESGKPPVYTPQLLLDAPTGAFLTFDTSIEIVNQNDVPTDPVVDLDIFIKTYNFDNKKAIQYTIYYGGQKVGQYVESDKFIDNMNSQQIFLFVRNDSQAIYEHVMAAARPSNFITGKNKDDWFKSYLFFKRQVKKGSIPMDKQFLFKDVKRGIQLYYNDFARLAREAKEYTVRFEAPAYVSALLDISDINPKYFIKKYEPTAFGAKITVVNSSSGATTLGESSNAPLFIVGVAAQELHSGKVTMRNIEDITQDDKKRTTERELNAAIYGLQSFSLDSQYIQSINHAKNLMRWITKSCNRPRIKFSIETFSNPLLELGDKVKIFDKSRGYYIDNNLFGNRTFVVSSIMHSVSNAGPSMNVTLTEVGQ